MSQQEPPGAGRPAGRTGPGERPRSNLGFVSEDDTDQEFDELLQMVRETRGFDFTGYKRSTLQRRVRRRMDARGLPSLSEYRDYLELEPDEFSRLFDSLLINVTGFFRDPTAWQALRETVLPELLAAKGPRRPIRVWSAGCATGEEAYTLAILLAEAIGVEDFISRVKIYATDLDEDALQQARAGVYTERQIAEVPEELRKKYFEPSGSRYAFRRDMRRQIIFGRNDLTRDAPISRVDLLVARNTLMYFNAEAQSSIIRKFHFALTDPGFLFLGKAEMLLNHSEQFEPVDLRRRIFRKVGTSALAEVPRMAATTAQGAGEPTTGLEAAALAAGPVAQLVIDRGGRLAAANLRAESLFNLRPRDVGRPFQDLEVSYRPIELRSIIEHVNADQRPVELTDVTWHRMPGSEPNVYDVSVVPLYRNSDEQIGVGISFLDVTRYRRLRDDLERSNHDLEHAYEELQSLNEELETTNEELQSTNEELETTNEELQSTNEELETMNEELQSTNDELQATNDVLRLRSGELDEVTSFLGAVLRSLGNAVVVVNTDLRVRVWGPGAEDMWGVRTDEAEGMFLTDLDIGLPVGEITPLLRQTLEGAPGRTEVDGMNRRGRPLRMEVQSRLLADAEGRSQGVILVMNETAGTS
jgi:two-component system CheB/CheR fusion protein